MRKKVAFLVSLLGLWSVSINAQSVDVMAVGNHINIRCNNATLSSVFAEISKTTQIEVTLEESVKSKSITSDIKELPVNIAVQKLLEGTRVVYAIMMDSNNWGRVNKIFIGSGGGGPSQTVLPVITPEMSPEPTRTDNASTEIIGDLSVLEDKLLEESDSPENDTSPNTQPVSPIPRYLPPQQAFPRSSFTPGLPTTTIEQNPQRQNNDTESLFFDAFGRPITTPPNPKKEQQR